ncbi:MAG: hypothetical protein EA404_02225 [Spirochaetaceae bacterium]|nr:MAG: hypothetical protein EA404_02225 [Spirochaetaceae bacterium]
MSEMHDLSQMDEKDARSYVVHCVTELNMQRRRLAERTRERDRWQKRARLAAEAGRDDLKRAAEEKLIDLSVEVETLQSEVRRLQNDAAELIQQLRLQRNAGVAVQFATALADQLEAAARGTPEE